MISRAGECVDVLPWGCMMEYVSNIKTWNSMKKWVL